VVEVCEGTVEGIIKQDFRFKPNSTVDIEFDMIQKRDHDYLFEIWPRFLHRTRRGLPRRFGLPADSA